MGAVKKELFCPEVCDTLMHPENVMDTLYLYYNNTQFAFGVSQQLKGIHAQRSVACIDQKFL